MHLVCTLLIEFFKRDWNFKRDGIFQALGPQGKAQIRETPKVLPRLLWGVLPEIGVLSSAPDSALEGALFVHHGENPLDSTPESTPISESTLESSLGAFLGLPWCGPSGWPTESQVKCWDIVVLCRSGPGAGGLLFIHRLDRIYRHPLEDRNSVLKIPGGGVFLGGGGAEGPGGCLRRIGEFFGGAKFLFLGPKRLPRRVCLLTKRRLDQSVFSVWDMGIPRRRGRCGQAQSTSATALLYEQGNNRDVPLLSETLQNEVQACQTR